MVDNTSANINEPEALRNFLRAASGSGGLARAVTDQERAGQAQVVVTGQLPARLQGGSQQDFEALGFSFGDMNPGDPLFRSAALPPGWRKVPSDHDLYTYIIDQLGRRRVVVMYKAAFYDREAFMALVSLREYVVGAARAGSQIVTDDDWATSSAVAAELRNEAARLQQGLGPHREQPSGADAEEESFREKVIALAEEFEGPGRDSSAS